MAKKYIVRRMTVQVFLEYISAEKKDIKYNIVVIGYFIVDQVSKKKGSKIVSSGLEFKT